MSGPRVLAGAPAPLFERLVDLAPHDPSDPSDAAVLGREDLRLSVERALARLLDARRPEPLEEAAARTALTVLDWGVPDLSGAHPAESRTRELFARAVRNAVAAFEPRLRDPAVEAVPVPGSRGRLRVAISGSLVWGDVAEQVAFQLDLDPDAAREPDGGVEP